MLLNLIAFIKNIVNACFVTLRMRAGPCLFYSLYLVDIT